MASLIDPTFPAPLVPTTQSVRDNFQHAHDEISVLQSAVSTLAIGVTDGSNAAAGQRGEYIVATGGSAALPLAIPNNATYNVTTLPLPAGDWEINGHISVSTVPANSYGMSALQAMISDVSANNGTLPNSRSQVGPIGGVAGIGFSNLTLPTGSVRISITAPTTFYLVAYAAVGAGTVTGYGSVQARRLR